MSDRELLELAARAVGGVDFDDGLGLITVDENGNKEPWNPLIFKADCLQMEINLKLDSAHNPFDNEWYIRGFNNGHFGFIAKHQDRQRASTMAAAAIGREM